MADADGAGEEFGVDIDADGDTDMFEVLEGEVATREAYFL